MGQQDLFRSRLNQMIDMKDGSVVVAGLIDLDRLAEACWVSIRTSPAIPLCRSA